MNDRRAMKLQHFLERRGVAILRVDQRDEFFPGRCRRPASLRAVARAKRSRPSRPDRASRSTTSSRPAALQESRRIPPLPARCRPCGRAARPSGVSRCDIFTPIRLPTAVIAAASFSRFRARFHERAAAEFHVEHEPIEILRQLLAHDARDDQRLRRHRAGDVAQGVEFLVRRADVGASARS